MNTSGHDPAYNSDASRQAAPENREFNLERIHRLVHDLEQELAHTDIPQADDLRREINTLKQMLEGPDEQDPRVRQRLHGVHNTLQDVTATVEGEVLRDSPYIAELGRILGLV
ncbi:hypothetical protein [Noviherbaspirillum massiliense]|uniref:hypothetical protein n=1 Tax=Noviherbaspirillum massiliense TaxID=1465823 RepID=UPI0002F047AF|nr:hypothetical protein [Noviherbaspirillum massiliense]